MENETNISLYLTTLGSYKPDGTSRQRVILCVGFMGLRSKKEWAFNNIAPAIKKALDEYFPGTPFVRKGVFECQCPRKNEPGVHFHFDFEEGDPPASPASHIQTTGSNTRFSSIEV